MQDYRVEAEHARRLSQAEEVARELISLMADIPLNSINVHVDVVLPKAERVRKPQDDRAHPAGSDAAAELRSAVLRMDIGELDGVNVADELARERDEPEFDWPVS